MSLLAAGIGAGVSLLADLFGQNSERNDQNKRLNKYRSELTDLLIDSEEEADLVNSYRRTSNTSVANANNKIGIAGANKANKGTFSAALLGPILAKQNEGEFNLTENIFNQNQNIKSKIAESHLSDPGSFNIGQSISAGLGGFEAGVSLDNYMNADEKFINKMKQMKELFGNSSIPSFATQMQGLNSLGSL